MRSEFEEFLEHLEWDKGCKERTLKTRKRHLREFSGWMDERGKVNVEEVARRDITRYVSSLVDDGYAPNTIMSRYDSVSAAFNFLFRDRRIDENPIDRIERQAIKSKAEEALSESERKANRGAKDYLSKAEVYELAEHAPEPTDRNELLIKLMFWTGLRVSEAVRIDIGQDDSLDGEGSDIYPDVPKIHAYGVKERNPKVVSYPRSELNPLLEDWVRHGRLRYKCAEDTNRLFVGRKKPLTESGVGRVVDFAAQNAGMQEVKGVTRDGREMKRITPHILRHSHAMYQHNVKGVPLDTVSDHLGHSSVSTTEEFYAESTEETIVSTFGE